MPTVQFPDPFNAVLLDSAPLVPTAEQSQYIMEVLMTACSDSRFAEKAFYAVMRILNAGPVDVPTITSLNPATAVIGDPSFDLHVMGTGFSPLSKIIFAGVEEPTTFVSDTELFTGINMPLWQGADVIPVRVLSNGIYSDPSDFTFSMPAARVAPKTPEKKHEIDYKIGHDPIGVSVKDPIKESHPATKPVEHKDSKK